MWWVNRTSCFEARTNERAGKVEVCVHVLPSPPSEVLGGVRAYKRPSMSFLVISEGGSLGLADPGRGVESKVIEGDRSSESAPF